MVDEEEKTPIAKIRNHPRLSKSIVVLPSLITAAGLFFGFFSIIYTLRSLIFGREEFLWAGYSIIIAGFLDAFDGRLARLMKAESEFGSQFDSIADMVSFGVAPAVLVYGTALLHMGRVGWAGAFLFLACAAIRLARFNVMSMHHASQKYFKGLPSPSAAGGLALCLILMSEAMEGTTFHYSVFGLTVFLALLMISNVRFRTFKEFDFQSHRIQTFIIIMFILLMIFSFRVYALFVLFICYLFGGLIEEVILWRRRRKSDPNVPFRPFGD